MSCAGTSPLKAIADRKGPKSLEFEGPEQPGNNSEATVRYFRHEFMRIGQV